MRTKTFISEYIVFALLAIAMVGVFLAFKVLNLPDVEFKGVSCFLTLFEVLLFAYGFAWAMSCYHFRNVKKLCRKLTACLFLTLFSVALTGCSAFDSDPIEPKIIGTTFLQKEKGLIFAEFDSERYAPTIIYTGETGRVSRTIKPIVGMQVTAFTSNMHQEPVFFAGQVTIEQIEEYYQYRHEGDRIRIITTICFILYAICFIICIIGICHPAKKQVIEDVDAHA